MEVNVHIIYTPPKLQIYEQDGAIVVSCQSVILHANVNSATIPRMILILISEKRRKSYYNNQILPTNLSILGELHLDGTKTKLNKLLSQLNV